MKKDYILSMKNVSHDFELVSRGKAVAFPVPPDGLLAALARETAMPVHLQREINFLNRLILQMGGQVEENLRHALTFLRNRDGGMPEEFRQRDRMVNELEIRVEEACLKILALHQPVASDLRYIVSVMKINNDLERVGDLAEHIARRASEVHGGPAFPEWIPEMSDRVRDMLKDSLDAMVKLDLELCRDILHRDKEVDALNRRVIEWFARQVQEMAGKEINFLTHTLLTAKDLERIGDHTCNIAEDIIYLISGEIVRHMEQDEQATA